MNTYPRVRLYLSYQDFAMTHAAWYPEGERKVRRQAEREVCQLPRGLGPKRLCKGCRQIGDTLLSSPWSHPMYFRCLPQSVGESKLRHSLKNGHAQHQQKRPVRRTWPRCTVSRLCA
jgi:hypothetical protein